MQLARKQLSILILLVITLACLVQAISARQGGVTVKRADDRDSATPSGGVTGGTPPPAQGFTKHP